jgi:hypothetical protein
MDMNETIRPMSLLVPRVEGVTGNKGDILEETKLTHPGDVNHITRDDSVAHG